MSKESQRTMCYSISNSLKRTNKIFCERIFFSGQIRIQNSIEMPQIGYDTHWPTDSPLFPRSMWATSSSSFKNFAFCSSTTSSKISKISLPTVSVGNLRVSLSRLRYHVCVWAVTWSFLLGFSLLVLDCTFRTGVPSDFCCSRMKARVL